MYVRMYVCMMPVQQMCHNSQHRQNFLLV